MIPLIQLRAKLEHSAWYIRPDYFQTVKSSIENFDFKQSEEDDIENFVSFFINQRPPANIDANGIGLITISGVLVNNASRFEKLLGLTDYEDIQAEIGQVLEDGAKAILFEMDSPGGEAQGAPETAKVIAEIPVPKASYSAGLDASAAYFLSSSMDRKFVSPSAFSGSIGTILPWVDSSKFFDALGLLWAPIVGTGETLKGAGMGPALTDTQRDHFQAEVNALSAAFRDHVANYRELDHTRLKGAAYFGEAALKFNLADQIGSYDDAYQWLFRLVS